MTDILEPPITVTCSPGPDVYGFRVREIEGHEELGCLFEYHLDLLSERHEIDLRSLLGKTMTVHVPLGLGQVRHLSGTVFRAERGQREMTHTEYWLNLRPDPYLLSFCHDCRIFQDVTVVEVAKQILEEHELPPFQTDLFETETYRRWDYLTQYQESDWDFIRRILALEGIYFYFNHLEDRHQMVLADSTSSHHARAGWETVPLLAQVNRGATPDSLRRWREASEVGTDHVVLRDFDFRLRGTSGILAGQKGPAATTTKRTLERYEYPGGFVIAENKDEADATASNAEGERLASVRMEEKQSSLEVFVGEGTARCLCVGALFGISDFPALADRQFMITSTDVVFRNPAPESGQLVTDMSFVRLTAIDHATPFRMRRLQKPIVRGPQTARVVGAEDEEIWTDKYGRVRVQFHWDRKGTGDENSACWVRVAHPWAGNRWGAIHIPRVGQEVVVEFLEGDPDRPIITGGVYNADNMPPYTLPENKTQSGIKSRSSKDGNAGNFNEIRFEDKKGHEELHMQAERDMSTHVRHDQSLTVGADRSIAVGENETTTVHGNRTATVDKDDTKTVHGSETTTIDKDRVLLVTGESTTKVLKKATLSFSADRATTVEGTDEDTVGKKVLKQAGTTLECADGHVDLRAQAWLKITHAGAKIHIDDGGNVTIETDKELKLLADGTSAVFAKGKAEISAENEATIAVGGNTFKVDKTGVTTSANNITSSDTGLHQMTAALITQN